MVYVRIRVLARTVELGVSQACNFKLGWFMYYKPLVLLTGAPGNCYA